MIWLGDGYQGEWLAGCWVSGGRAQRRRALERGQRDRWGGEQVDELSENRRELDERWLLFHDIAGVAQTARMAETTLLKH